MGALPDPRVENFLKGKTWLQSNVPGNLTLVDTNLNFKINGSITWIATYCTKGSMDTPQEFSKYVSSKLGKHCKVCSVNGIFDGKRMKWQVSIVPRKPKGTTLWDYIIPSLTFTNTKAPGHDKGVNNERKGLHSKERKTHKKFAIVKVRPDECKILGSDDVLYTLKELTANNTILPKKLFHHGSDITKKVFGKSRLCNHFVSILKKYSDKPLIRSKMELKTFVSPSDADHKKQGSTKPSVSPEPARTRVAIPLCYENIDRNYKFSKLRDRLVFRSALEFVTLYERQQKIERGQLLGGVRKYNIPLDLRHHLLSNGLPVDELLVKLFYDYCTEVGIGENDIEIEKGQILHTYLKRTL